MNCYFPIQINLKHFGILLIMKILLDLISLFRLNLNLVTKIYAQNNQPRC